MNPFREFIPCPTPKRAARLDEVLLECSVLQLQKGDCIAITCKYFLSATQKDEIFETVRKFFPSGTPILLLDQGLEIGVIRQIDEAA